MTETAYRPSLEDVKRWRQSRRERAEQDIMALLTNLAGSQSIALSKAEELYIAQGLLSEDGSVFLKTSEGFKCLLPREALAHLIDEHLRSMQFETKKRREYQYLELLLDLLPDVGKPDRGVWTEDKLRDAIKRASSLIESFRYASQQSGDFVEPPLDEPERYRVIWRHRDLGRAFREGFTSTDACPTYRGSFVDVASAYLRQESRSPKFEVLLVDALVASEVYTYSEELKRNPSRWVKQFSLNWLALTMDESSAYYEAKGNLDKLAWARLKTNLKRSLILAALIYGAPIGIAWLAIKNNREGIVLTAVAFLVLVVGYQLLRWMWRRLRSLFRTPDKEPLVQAIELHGKMVRAYEELRSGTSSSPQRVREVLAKLADEGAVWEPEVFSILDVALARSAGNWG
jgi:hypothetical protein